MFIHWNSEAASRIETFERAVMTYDNDADDAALDAARGDILAYILRMECGHQKAVVARLEQANDAG